MEGATTYELQLAQLHQHHLQLKGVQSDQGKAELKARLLPEYVPYIEGVLSAGKGAQDDVLTTVMLWRFDASDYVGGLDIAAYVLQHGLKMPDRFARTTGCLVAEEVAEAALKALKAGGDFDGELLQRADQLTASHDMPDQVRAKLALARGKVALQQVNPEQLDTAAAVHLNQAEALFGKAIALHDKCGAKKDLEKTQRLLKKHAEAKPS